MKTERKKQIKKKAMRLSGYIKITGIIFEYNQYNRNLFNYPRRRLYDSSSNE